MPRGSRFVLLGAWLALAGHAQAQPANPTECATWQECREQVEQAIAGGAFERAHDLAWRAVQRGPTDDAALMFLLARAQSLAGRPHDALVMVRRIAERGIPTEALTHPELGRMRALPGWPDVETVVARANASGATATAEPPAGPEATSAPEAPRIREASRAEASRPSGEAPAAAAPRREPRSAGSPTAPEAPRFETRAAPMPETPAAPTHEPAAPTPVRAATTAVLVEASAPMEEGARFTTDRFVAAGLAYDAVSRRYLFGDRDGRKLRVVGEGLDHAVDLVRAESAGFLDVQALAIDTRRGDLWVASGDADGRTAALHKLQLISGRPLRSVSFAVDDEPVVPVDVAIAADGTVIVLDANGGLHRLPPGASAIERIARVPAGRATSLAPAEDGVWFVAHESGVSRVDVASGRVAAVGAPPEVSLAAFERIRAHRDGLVGIQADADGTRRIVRLALAGRRRSVQRATIYDTRIASAAGPVFLAVSGDDLSFVTTGPHTASPTPAGAMPAREPADVVVHRLRLR